MAGAGSAREQGIQETPLPPHAWMHACTNTCTHTLGSEQQKQLPLMTCDCTSSAGVPAVPALLLLHGHDLPSLG